MRLATALLLFAAAGVSLSAQPEFSAHRGWVHVNGYSHHFAVDNANDRLLGIGYTHFRKRFGRVLPAWEFDAFQDSGRKFSGYVGHSWTVPFRHASIGVTAALMYHRNFAAQNSMSTLPVALPFLETRSERIKLRIYYVPPVRSASDHQVALQVMLPLWR